jgi:hypothetical protein
MQTAVWTWMNGQGQKLLNCSGPGVALKRINVRVRSPLRKAVNQ